MALTDFGAADNPTLLPAVEPDRDASDRPESSERGSSKGRSTNADDGSPVRRQVSHRHVQGLLMRARRFTPSWFSTVMGTGIVNTLFFQLPWTGTHPAFRGIGAAFLVLAMILFVAFAAISIFRYARWPEIARRPCRLR